MKTLTASVAQVEVGLEAPIEGLMFEEGNYAVAVPQVCDLFGLDGHNATRYLKTLLGGELEITKAITPLNSKAVNTVSLETFRKILVGLCLKGNKVAAKLTVILLELSLHQLFCDAFNVKFEKEDREKWLKARNGGMDARKEFASAINAANWRGEIIDFGQATLDVYALCGLLKRYKDHKRVSKKEFRDTLGTPELELLATIERDLAVMLNSGYVFDWAKAEVGFVHREQLSLANMSS